jgi:16S rRNA (guanine966-N2)-methyltransferase
MRIVGGKFKGRGLKAPSSSIVRPTSDRLRETIFNILAHGHDDACEGARVIDLFAGTGALGIEALSRGATGGLFVDDSNEGRALLRANLEAFGLSGVARIMRRDATKLGAMPPQEKFTLAFLDPPYGRDLAPRALAALRDGAWLADGALCVVEEAAGAEAPLPQGFTLLDRRESGDTQVLFARFAT